MNAKLGFIKPINVANRLGWITRMQVTQRTDSIDVSTWGGGRLYIPQPKSMEIDLHVVAQDPGALSELFRDWMNLGISSPQFVKEYMCLYCGTPNSIEYPSCKKCGAPRSFVIG